MKRTKANNPGDPYNTGIVYHAQTVTLLNALFLVRSLLHSAFRSILTFSYLQLAQP